jgi:Flp pilus assembly protein TadD
MGQRGLALLEHAEGTAVLVPASCVTTADALLALGRASEARALCERGLAAEEKASTVDPEKVYEWDALRCQGEALLVEGRGSEALGSLERSVTLTRREWPGDLALARFGVARALVATRGDAGRARSLAKLARDELAARPELKGQLTVLEAWLASHP